MVVCNNQIVCRIEADPAAAGKENGKPCVRSLRSLHLRPRPHISADIPCCEALGTNSADHHVCEILTDTPAMPHYLGQRCTNRSRLRFVLEIRMNTMGQIFQCLK